MKQAVTVDLFKLRAEHSDRQIADAGLVKDLIDNLIDYGVRLNSAEARIEELQKENAALKAAEAARIESLPKPGP